MPAAGRDTHIADREWLWDMLSRTGESSVGRLVGLDRKTVTKWRLYHDIPAWPRGRRRGIPTGRRATDLANLPASLQLLVELLAEERVASDTLLSDRIRKLVASRGADVAHARAEDLAFDQALIELASACTAFHEHRRTVRSVA